jgi:hypothetical protein
LMAASMVYFWTWMRGRRSSAAKSPKEQTHAKAANKKVDRRTRGIYFIVSRTF